MIYNKKKENNQIAFENIGVQWNRSWRNLKQINIISVVLLLSLGMISTPVNAQSEEILLDQTFSAMDSFIFTFSMLISDTWDKVHTEPYNIRVDLNSALTIQIYLVTSQIYLDFGKNGYKGLEPLWSSVGTTFVNEIVRIDNFFVDIESWLDSIIFFLIFSYVDGSLESGRLRIYEIIPDSLPIELVIGIGGLGITIVVAAVIVVARKNKKWIN